MHHFEPGTPLLTQLTAAKLQLDGLLQRALEVAASAPDIEPEDEGFPDSYLTLALYRLNTVLTRALDLDEKSYNIFHEYKIAPRCDPSDVRPGRKLCSVLNQAVSTLGDRAVIGTGDFIRAIVELSVSRRAYDYAGWALHDTFSIETLLIGLGWSAWTHLEHVPELAGVLKALAGRDPVQHPEYILTLSGDRIVLRPASVVAPCTMIEDRGPRQRLSMVSRLESAYTGVHAETILELEDLINRPNPSEHELQQVFENHPQLFRFAGHADIFPHVYLTRENDGPLVPDFILLDRELQRATVLDLKLPSKRIAAGTKDRRRYTSAVTEARAQLLRYRDWFESDTNRRALKDRHGMDVYRPRLAVVIGRRSGFASELERQTLQASERDVDVVTYDDILEQAKRRLLLIQSAPRT